MLRIEKIVTGNHTIIRLSGRIEAKHVPELKKQVENDPRPIAMDLEDLKLVDAGAVRFLGSSEIIGIELWNCPPFVREWIRRERQRLSWREGRA